MREIKFRAWDEKNKKMMQGSEKEPHAIMVKGVPLIASFDALLRTLQEEFILMQYTGLKDKNGKEIYEFMELDEKYEVIYVAPKYVLRDISNGDIIDLYENQHTITKEYTKV